MAVTSIEWTDATWNPVAGCKWASPGCDLCYAARMTRRLEAMGQADYAGLTTRKHFNGTFRPLPHKLNAPLKWKKPRMVFVNSMSDLFGGGVPEEFIFQVFNTMGLAYQHTFQVLTKRAERMRDVVAKWVNREGRDPARMGEPLPNVWLGVSVEDQQRADGRIIHLVNTPAAVKFLSCEPLLGSLDLTGVKTGSWAYGHVDVMAGYPCGAHPDECYDWDADPRGWVRKPAGEWERGECGVDWVIVGCESGNGRRPMKLDWAREIRDQCAAAGVPLFIKQLPVNGSVCKEVEKFPADLRIREFPTRKATP